MTYVTLVTQVNTAEMYIYGYCYDPRWCLNVVFTRQKNSDFSITFDTTGDVAQLARALDWQSRGRGFESHLLHLKTEGLQRCSPFFVFSIAHYLHTSPIIE